MSDGRHVLVGAYAAPEPDRDSGSKRLDDMISFLLDAGWQVTFATTRPHRDMAPVEALQRRGVGVFHMPAHELSLLASAARFDLALLAFWPTAELYVPVLRKISPQTRIAVDSVDLHFVRHARRIVGGGATRLLDARFGDQVVGELNAYAAADGVLTASAKEAELVNDLLGEPGLAMVAPDSEEVARRGRPFAERHGILFVGSFRHPPNIDAAWHLCHNIVPRLPTSLLAEHNVLIVGDGMTDQVRAFGDGLPQVRMVGWVPSLDPYYEQARISVLPLLSGAGTKRKLIQALMHGTPTVTTSIGAEGFALTDGRDVLMADDSEAFAHAITRLIGDERVWRSLADHGRTHMIESHGTEVARAAFDQAIQQVLERAPKGPLLPDRGEEDHHQRLLYQYEQSLVVSGTRRSEISPIRAEAELSTEGAAADADVRLIALYLPQFHAIPENDQWWGPGFTEWTNVRAAKPLFEGHVQPHVPGELGYYDLLDPETRERQADLARTHGIHGFCWYHYWFDGKRLLERPFDEVLATERPNFPFALCWANEPWSRRWHGRDEDVLQPQSYNALDDLAHIRALLPALADPRAIKVGGKPLLIIYQGRELPDPERLTETWRNEVGRAGLAGLHLLAVETGWDAGWDATSVGFDGKVRFQPQFSILKTLPPLEVARSAGVQAFDYRTVWPVLSELPPVAYRTYETVVAGWDNTPRRGRDGLVIHDATPDLYERWLAKEIARARERPPGERLVFLNAWNEWAEGAHLEPDAVNGRAFLEATQRALAGTRRRLV